MIVPKKMQPDEISQKSLYVDYSAVNILLPTVFKVNSKVHGAIRWIFPEVTICWLLRSNVYSSLDCTLNNYITLSDEEQKKSSFVSPTGKCEFKKVPFGLVQADAHFQQVINEVLNGLDFAFGYLDDTHFQHYGRITPEAFMKGIWMSKRHRS